MINIPTVIDRRIKGAVPSRTAWIEAWGFLLMGFGLFLGLACYTYTPYDYTASGLAGKIHNLAGPLGAIAANEVLGRFGVIGMAWPVVFALWGVLTATGFVILPRPRRLLGFLAITTTIAGFFALQLPRTDLPVPSFGFGGTIGFQLKLWLLPNLGYGGTLIALGVMGICSLVLTGNLRASRTAEASEYGIYMLRRGTKKVWKKYVQPTHTLTNEGTIAASVRAPVEKIGVSAASAARIAKRSATAEVEAEQAAQNVKPGFEMTIDYNGPTHGKPSPSMFTKSSKNESTTDNFEKKARDLTQGLAEFKIMGEVKSVTKGPVVTTYEFEPAPGTKLSKISALGEDLARLLKAQSLRVLAPIPGKDTVGFEVPNTERAMIGFQELIDSKDFRSQKRQLPIAMGVDIFGKPVIEDLAEMPHLLVAGSTGSGKSVFMNTLIGSLIARHSAKDLRLIMVDPKMVEMAAYNGLPHLACPVITDPHGEALGALNGLVKEMDERYQRMRMLGARNITSFNDIVKNKRKSEFPKYEGKWSTMPYVVLIIDELADMMMTLGKDAETPITRLAQKARACGIHLVIATQRPSAEVVTGLIKANFPTRVAFRVMSGIDSRTILDQNGAETLLGKGDMLHMATGTVGRVHGAYLSEKEVSLMVKACGRGSKR